MQPKKNKMSKGKALKIIELKKEVGQAENAALFYRMLLVKYMLHIEEQEGAFFIAENCLKESIADFDKTEIEELKMIEKELKQVHNEY